MIDINTCFGSWPYQLFPDRTASEFSEHLAAHGIESAWVSAVESILFPDPDVFDNRLFEQIQGVHGLNLVKTVNPTLGGWKKRLLNWIDDKGVQAVKLLPSYHQYSLNAPEVKELVTLMRDRKLPLFIQMRVDDERNQYFLMRVPGVPLEQVSELAAAFPGHPIVLLCPYHGEAAALAKQHSNLYMDISFLEHIDTIRSVLEFVPPEQLLFGTHSPFLCTGAAVNKIKFASVDQTTINLITHENAKRILSQATST